MLQHIVAAFVVIIQPLNLLLLLSGIMVGMIFGAIPGLTATLAISLLLPITFGLSPIVGMLLLCGVWIGGVSGSFISAVLIGIPGTASSVATVFDGYPLTQKGQAVKALGIGIVSSFIGTIGSIIAAMLFSPLVLRLALKFGPWEYFALGVTALTFIGSFCKENIFKGLAAGLIGLTFRTIGMAPIDGNSRFDFGLIGLKAGLGILPLILGIFAITQIAKDFANNQSPINADFKITGFGVLVIIRP